MATSDRTIRWIESLAKQEELITSGEKSALDLGMTKDEVLIGETDGFVRDVVYHLEYLVRLFNSRVNNSHIQIRLVRATKNQAFSLNRNKMKFTLVTPKPGKIQIQCLKIMAEGASTVPKTSIMFSGTVEAHFGVFNDIDWQFLCQTVTSEQVAKHYLTEFIQVSVQTETH